MLRKPYSAGQARPVVRARAARIGAAIATIAGPRGRRMGRRERVVQGLLHLGDHLTVFEGST
ncbi:hypothetical protein CAL15_16130 [Bordetella genomosp. 13]|uniref:Uncharacterized protein n=1 Tax=Bordetella genomosp. 13 TaxID=463040 RepID=A0A1W6ZF48_9BORD|nr:hypothetical protein CAL15_16130 [Bordetella genomosp. 13]